MLTEVVPAVEPLGDVSVNDEPMQLLGETLRDTVHMLVVLVPHHRHCHLSFLCRYTEQECSEADIDHHLLFYGHELTNISPHFYWTAGQLV